MHDFFKPHWHEPSGDQRSGFGTFERLKTPYDRFMESEGIPIFRGIGVNQIHQLPRKLWKRMGGEASFIQLTGTESKWGCFVVEITGRGALNPIHHMYEQIFCVFEGRGSTEVWLDGDSKRHTFEWQPGSLFSIPFNA